jgi:hypothetical protein
MQNAPVGVSLDSASVQLADMNGDGRADLLVTDGIRAGYYPLTFEGNWDRRGFMPYTRAPMINLEEPTVRMLDLTGDGITDALRTGTNFELYYNDGDNGWRDVELRPRGETNDFPNVTFNDPRVKLADMNGDGLLDIVLVHNRGIDYWPYLGYG